MHLYTNHLSGIAESSISNLVVSCPACFSWIIKHNLSQNKLGVSEGKMVLSEFFTPDASIVLLLKLFFMIFLSLKVLPGA